MKIRKDKIALKITNNTALPQTAEILGQIPLNDGTNNAVSLYTWNLATENFIGLNEVAIQIGTISNPTLITYTEPLASNTLDSIVTALNSLNQGFFQSSGNTIYVSSNTYVYGDIYATSNLFISTWNTANTSVGSSASNQVQLPLTVGGTYNFVVDWGDGTTDTITTWNQAETLHTYISVGTYIINIAGTITGWLFNTTGDRNKILSITNWGDLKLTNTGAYFSGCTNLDLSGVADVLNLSGITSLGNAFNSCSSLTTINRINEWDVSGITDISNTFQLCISFNQSLSNWNVSNVLFMNSTFNTATAFNQDLSNWNIISLTSAISFMANKTDSDYLASYLDAIYNKWSLLSVQPNVTINFGTIKYTASGSAGKAILQNVPNNWIITDGGI